MLLDALEPRTLFTVVTAGPVSVTEGTANAAVRVTLDAPRRSDLNLNYKTVPDSARQGRDYTHTEGVLTIPAGQTSGTVNVPLIDNAVYNPNRSFRLRVSVPDDDDKVFSVVTITDNERPPTLTVSNVRYLEPRGLNPNTVDGFFLEQPVKGKRGVDFVLTLSVASSQKITADFNFTDNTAVAGQDYDLHRGRVTFQPGQTTRRVRLYLRAAPKVAEPRQSLNLVLSNPRNVTLASQSSLITLRSHLANGQVDPADKPPAPRDAIIV